MMERHVREVGIAGLALALGMVAAPGQEMKAPRIAAIAVDWAAAGDDARALVPHRFPEIAAADGEPAAAIMAQINRATGERFTGIAASPVPVLLPFDTRAFLADGDMPAEASAGSEAAPRDYLHGFQRVSFFHPGPAGYDAVVMAQAREMPDLGVASAHPIAIHVGGSALLYELDEPAGMVEWPVRGLDEFPGIRRLYLERQVRYTFTRYGVPYVVAIDCVDGGPRARRISCRSADKVAMRFLRALRIVGGTPSEPQAATPSTIERPQAPSTVFTYHPTGSLLRGTGFKRRTGVADYTVYSRIRFPIAEAPAFANSQSFMNWGNCEATGRLRAGMLGRTAAYRCRVNGQPLVADESAASNYSYPWRDNFCEHRFFFVGQCPAGLGHQGQDIRPASCRQRKPGANRCEPERHGVVAARDGAVLRAPGQESLYIVTNAANERVRFRYLHMNPKRFDADGLSSGRRVREGEVIGKVGNYFKRERATSYHLHFDLQVPTRYGWVFVNPYMTLVAAYERLIQGRGRQLQDIEEIAAPPQPAEPARGEPQASRGTAAKPTETRLESTPPRALGSGMSHHAGKDEPSTLTSSVPAVAGRGAHGDGGYESGRAGAGAGGLRAVGRGLPGTGARARDFRRHLHTGDGRHQARYPGL
jgi:hypothetical protein